MAIQSQTIKIIMFILVNSIILLTLFYIPINNFSPKDICVFKNLFGVECWNCGMTRAFLSILHLDFDKALDYNKNVIIVFPFTILVYLYSWYKYIVKTK